MKAIRKNSKVRKSTRKPEERFVQSLQVRGEVMDDADDDMLLSGATHGKAASGAVVRKRFSLS